MAVDRGRRRQPAYARLRQLRAGGLVEPGHVVAGRADAERERLPPVRERGEPERHRQRVLLGIGQSRCPGQFDQLALPSAGELGLAG